MNNDQFTNLNRVKSANDDLLNHISETIQKSLDNNIREKQRVQRKERRLRNLEKKIKNNESKQTVINNTNRYQAERLECRLASLEMEVNATRRAQWFIILLLLIINIAVFWLK